MGYILHNGYHKCYILNSCRLTLLQFNSKDVSVCPAFSGTETHKRIHTSCGVSPPQRRGFLTPLFACWNLFRPQPRRVGRKPRASDNYLSQICNFKALVRIIRSRPHEIYPRTYRRSPYIDAVPGYLPRRQE